LGFVKGTETVAGNIEEIKIPREIVNLKWLYCLLLVLSGLGFYWSLWEMTESLAALREF
jgi:hypothetical protein